MSESNMFTTEDRTINDEGKRSVVKNYHRLDEVDMFLDHIQNDDLDNVMNSLLNDDLGKIDNKKVCFKLKKRKRSD